MAYLKLIRQRPDGLAVRGTLYLASYDTFAEEEVLTKLCSTLENRDYLIPPLIYRLTVTYSPKFKRPLPLVNGVPKEIKQPRRASASDRESQQANKELCKPTTPGLAGKADLASEAAAGGQNRTGIRFHPGSKPEHSKGCILVSRADENMLRELILGEREVRMEVNEEPRIYVDNNE